jgi:hypothetical protein
MPKEWAASGGRLLLRVPIDVSPAPARDPDAERFVGRGACRVQPGPGTFTGGAGLVTVDAREGGWSIQKRDETPQTLRFWIDFSAATGVVSRGVDLPAERLFFTSDAFEQPQIDATRAALVPAKTAVLEAEAKLAEVKQTAGAAPPLRLLAQTRAQEALQLARDAKEALDARLPSDDRDVTPGRWPGVATRLAIAGGSVTVKRRALFREQYNLVGTWTASPVLEDPVEAARAKRLYY